VSETLKEKTDLELAVMTYLETSPDAAECLRSSFSRVVPEDTVHVTVTLSPSLRGGPLMALAGSALIGGALIGLHYYLRITRRTGLATFLRTWHAAGMSLVSRTLNAFAAMVPSMWRTLGSSGGVAVSRLSMGHSARGGGMGVAGSGTSTTVV